VSEVFVWDRSFLTGLASVDDQHQRLVSLINDIGELSMLGQDVGREHFLATHDELVDYARFHFADEERQMAAAGLDPEFVRAHKAAHRAFVDRAQTMAEAAADDPHQVHDLLHYLVRWLAYHILGIDQRMARQMEMVKAGMDPAEAYREDSQRHPFEETAEPLLKALQGLYSMVSERNRLLRELNRTLELRVSERTAQLEEANRLLQSLAIHDELTGLPNRRAAMMNLQRYFTGELDDAALSVLLLDADDFKSVNDQYGHTRGDAVLRTLAQRLRDSVRTSDMVCRLGGDEFLVICPESSLAGALQAASKILDAEAPYRLDSGEVAWRGGISIGAARLSPLMQRPEDLLQLADQHLYRAKRAGGNRCWPESTG